MEYAGLFTQAELDAEVQAGYVRSNVHPDNSELWILNYTEKAAYESHWNNVTLNCRGLIIGPFCNIVARPFSKFFNYGQPDCPEIDLDEPAVVSDKMDGSLGIMYKLDGKLAIATRGSFTSDQAIHATNLLRTKYSKYVPPKGITLLFEIVYPENRIVCDYGDMDDLVLLGSVDTEYGDSWDADALDWDWPGPKTEVFPYLTMREALTAKPRKGAEGFVVHLVVSDIRVKIKQEDYIALHRIVTGLNARSVWQAMVDGTFDELLEQVPDEFHDFVNSVATEIDVAVRTRWAESWKEFVRIEQESDNRKNFALQALKSPYKSELFLHLDGKNVIQFILEKMKPAHDYSPIKVSNDAD
jgi:putative RNA ligase